MEHQNQTQHQAQNQTDSSDKFFLPSFANRRSSSQSSGNIGTANLATVGLFSALAACGGSGSVDTGSAPVFNAFVLEDGNIDGVMLDAGGTNNAEATTISVRENVGREAAVLIGAVTASDADPSDKISYSISGNNDASKYLRFFELDAGTGALSIKQGADLDFDTAPMLTFTIVASSGEGAFAHTSAHTITINLGDVEDGNAPVFAPYDNNDIPLPDTVTFAGGNADTTTINISEGVDITNSIFLGVITATDADPGPGTDGREVVSYEIKGGDDVSNLFRIDKVNDEGYLSTKDAATFDFETAPMLTFTIIASSGDGASAHTAAHVVTINVGDVPVGNAPVFEGVLSAPPSSGYPPPRMGVTIDAANSNATTTTITIKENVSTTDTLFLGVITASDADDNDTVAYSLDGTDANLFDINSGNGVVEVKNTTNFDYETDPMLTFNIIATSGASDGKHTASHAVTIQILDVSDSLADSLADFQLVDIA